MTIKNIQAVKDKILEILRESNDIVPATTIENMLGVHNCTMEETCGIYRELVTEGLIVENHLGYCLTERKEVMNILEREKWIEELQKEESEIRKAKGHDYSIDDDCMGNLRKHGWRGLLIRIGDKIARLEAFSQKGKFKVKDETLKDTIMDARNYLAFLLLMFDEENKEADETES